MAAKINIEITGFPLGSPGESEIHPYSVIESSSPLINLSLTDDTGVNQYFWSFVSRPLGSTVTLVNATSPIASFNPDIGLAGTYIVQCSLNNGATILTNGVAFTTEVMEVRIPSAKETKEFDAYAGWDPALQDFMRKVDDGIGGIGATYWEQFAGSLIGGSGVYLKPALDERVSLPAGTYNEPSLVFGGDADTGFWLRTTGELSSTINGHPGVTLYEMFDGLYLESYDVDDSRYEFYLCHYKESSAGPAAFYVMAIGTDDNAGSILNLWSRAGYTVGSSYVEVAAYDGTDTHVGVSAYNSSGYTSSISILAIAEDITSVNVHSRCMGTEWSYLQITSESIFGGASLVLSCKGKAGASVDEGRIQIGESNTGKITFWNADIYAAPSWPGDYVYLIDDFTEMDDYYSAFGEVSLINAIVQASTTGFSVSGLTEDQIVFGAPSGALDQSPDFMLTDTLRFKVAADSIVSYDYSSVFGRYVNSEFSGAQFVAYSRRGTDTGSAQVADNLVLVCETTGDDTASFRLVSGGTDNPIKLSENRVMAFKVKVVSSGVDTSTGVRVQERHVLFWNSSVNSWDWGPAATVINDRSTWASSIGVYMGGVDGEFGLSIAVTGTSGNPNIFHVAYVTEMVIAQTAYNASS
jgi:hypothetical protein